MKYLISRETFDQIRWERDVAIQQLRDLGYSLGEKPKENKGEPKTGHWEPKYPTREEMIYCQERYFCSNCKGYVVDRIARLEFNFCPNCGARMKGGE